MTSRPAVSDVGGGNDNVDYKTLFRVRTITAFVVLRPSDFDDDGGALDAKIGACDRVLRAAASRCAEHGYEVQTTRIATNPFDEWSSSDDVALRERAARLDDALAAVGVDFCAVGCARDPASIGRRCPAIVAASPRFSCSAVVDASNAEAATAAARACLAIARSSSLDNFRFGTVSSCPPFVPFFPGARCRDDDPDQNDGLVGFALGLENGRLARRLLTDCEGALSRVPEVFGRGHAAAVEPLDRLFRRDESNDDDPLSALYLGVDTSLNPSLDPDGGSVAEALETLLPSSSFGGPGTLAAAAAVTDVLQSTSCRTTGYRGLMLPVMEDERLAALWSSSSSSSLDVARLLSVSSVCGVGVDCVPIPIDTSPATLASLYLDVAGLAGRWNKPLSCRVFPVEGNRTTFDSPYMCNSDVAPLE